MAVSKTELQQVTNRMLRIERLVSFYNLKYLFKGVLIPENKRRTYAYLLREWDQVKVKRDSLRITQTYNNIFLDGTVKN